MILLDISTFSSSELTLGVLNMHISGVLNAYYDVHMGFILLSFDLRLIWVYYFGYKKYIHLVITNVYSTASFD